MAPPPSVVLTDFGKYHQVGELQNVVPGIGVAVRITNPYMIAVSKQLKPPPLEPVKTIFPISVQPKQADSAWFIDNWTYIYETPLDDTTPVVAIEFLFNTEGAAPRSYSIQVSYPHSIQR